MTMDQSAVALIQNTASANKVNEILVRALEGSLAVAIPKDHNLESLERFQNYRDRFRATFSTNTLQDFAAYVRAQEVEAELQRAIYVDAKTLAAVAIFNLYTDDGQPGHADHRAAIQLIRTAAFSSLIEADGQRQTQRELAEWLEDWRDHIIATDESGSELPMIASIQAVRRITMDASKKSESTIGNFNETKSDLEKIEASSAGNILPTYFLFRCIPYESLQERTFKLRMSIITGHEPKLVVRIIRFENDKEEMAKEFQHLVATQMPEGTQVLLGSLKV